MKSKRVFVVLIYPPKGRPRVEELSVSSLDVLYPLKWFGDKESAEQELERFLSRNPEYRAWRDGQLQK